MRQEWGISTVIMIKRGNPCPLCLPFCGKILIDDVWSGGSAKDGPYPLMSYAISQGLYHPRCKDSHTTYFEGISTPPDDVYTQEEIKEIEEKYKLEQKRLYAEKQSKKYGRLARYSLDEKEKKKYRAKQKKWRYAAKRYSYDFDGVEIFETLDARGKGKPVLEYQDIVNEIKSSEIGLELMSHLVENDVPVYLMYGVDQNQVEELCTSIIEEYSEVKRIDLWDSHYEKISENEKVLIKKNLEKMKVEEK